MPKNPPEGMTRVTPYIFYSDVAAALDWLCATFGCTESVRMPGPDGVVTHGEVKFGDNVIMMGRPSATYENPKKHGHIDVMIYVYVDDVDAHYEHAKKHGAAILEAPADQFYGDRTYAVEDIEGHHWDFAQHVKDVDFAQIPG